MSRFAVQPDLFAPPRASAPTETAEPPVDKLRTMLADMRRAAAPPWPSLSIAREEEYRAMALAREAGEEGAALLSAYFEETERLHAMTD